MQSRPQPNKVTVGGVHGGAAAVEVDYQARTVSVDKTQQNVPPTTQLVPTGPMLMGVSDPRALDVYYKHV